MDHSHSRQLSESLEDYLEAILQIITENGVAWPRDIAKAMKVSNASVTGALRALAERSLINYSPYAFVTLTPEGEEHAREITQRHETIRDFLSGFLGVEEGLANETACKMEHILAPEIIQKFVRLASFMKSSPCGGKEWLSQDVHSCAECHSSGEWCGGECCGGECCGGECCGTEAP